MHSLILLQSADKDHHHSHHHFSFLLCLLLFLRLLYWQQRRCQIKTVTKAAAMLALMVLTIFFLLRHPLFFFDVGIASSGTDLPTNSTAPRSVLVIFANNARDKFTLFLHPSLSEGEREDDSAISVIRCTPPASIMSSTH
mmetsp:Transcript_13229/g.19264  ORF Transcript_13229/g.19264 Transcript_13229/m.19264 type:complete len:140 (+) Transcript_13229:753-1172(+)